MRKTTNPYQTIRDQDRRVRGMENYYLQQQIGVDGSPIQDRGTVCQVCGRVRASVETVRLGSRDAAPVNACGLCIAGWRAKDE